MPLRRPRALGLPRINLGNIEAGAGPAVAAVGPQDYRFGTHAEAMYNYEALKSQVWRSVRTPPSISTSLGSYLTAFPQDPTQLAAQIFPTLRTAPVVSRYISASPQLEERATIQLQPSLAAGATPRIGVYQLAGPIDTTQLSAQYALAATPVVLVSGFLGRYTVAGPQLADLTQQPTLTPSSIGRPSTMPYVVATPQQADLTQQATLSAPVVGRSLAMPFVVGAPQLIDLTQQPVYSAPAVTPPAIFGPTISAFVALPQDDTSLNYSITWTPSTFSPGNPLPPAVSSDGHGHPRDLERELETRLFQSFDTQQPAEPEQSGGYIATPATPVKHAKAAIDVTDVFNAPSNATSTPLAQRYDAEIMAILWMLM